MQLINDLQVVILVAKNLNNSRLLLYKEGEAFKLG